MCGLEMQDYQAAMQTAVSLHLQFMTGDICGNGFKRAPGLSSCSLHTARVPVEALTGEQLLPFWRGSSPPYVSLVCPMFCLPTMSFTLHNC